MDTKTAEEVSAIMEEIEDRMGRKQPLILVYVTDPSVESSVTEEIGDSKNDLTCISSDLNALQQHINSFTSDGKKRLFLVFSRSFGPSDTPLSIPDSFAKCEITCCAGATAHFDNRTKYCDLPLPGWSMTESRESHELNLRQGVYITHSFDGLASNAVNATPSSQLIAQKIYAATTNLSPDQSPLLKFSLGISTAKFCMLVIADVVVGATGLYIRAHVEGLGRPIAYFIPWETLTRALLIDLDWAISVLQAVWRFIRGNFEEVCAKILKLLSKPGEGDAGIPMSQCSSSLTTGSVSVL